MCDYPSKNPARVGLKETAGMACPPTWAPTGNWVQLYNARRGRAEPEARLAREVSRVHRAAQCKGLLALAGKKTMTFPKLALLALAVGANAADDDQIVVSTSAWARRTAATRSRAARSRAAPAATPTKTRTALSAGRRSPRRGGGPRGRRVLDATRVDHAPSKHPAVDIPLRAVVLVPRSGLPHS